MAKLEKVFDFRVDGVEVLLAAIPRRGLGVPLHLPRHRPDERIVYAYRMELDGVPMSSSLATIEIRPDGEGSQLTLTEYGVYFDGFREGGHEARARHRLAPTGSARPSTARRRRLFRVSPGTDQPPTPWGSG